jgi:hypothetical protein
MKNVIAAARIRGAEWNGVANKIRDCAMSESHDINAWCMAQAQTCWARGDEAYAIAKILESKDNEL